MHWERRKEGSITGRGWNGWVFLRYPNDTSLLKSEAKTDI